MKAMPRSLTIASRARQAFLPALVLALTIACGADEAPDAPAAEPATSGSSGGASAGGSDDTAGTSGPTLLGPGEGGAVSGRVVHSGPVEAGTVAVTGDAFCIGAAQEMGGLPDQSLVVGDGGLAHAFVYVDVDTDAWEFPEASGEVVIDQVGCLYTPRVVGVRVKQDLTFVNSDATLHNVHTTGINKENNVAMPVEGMRKTVSMRKPEVMGKVACDVHPWMAGWFGVMEHPCFAVTDGQGRFSIAGVPPGEHTLKIWHETLGTREVQVTVTAGGTATVDDVSL